MKLSNNTHFEALELIRGIAAVFVVIGHSRSLLFLPYNETNTRNVIAQFFYFITGFGHQAVVVFFVLSGFLITLSLLKSREQNFREYLLLRVCRLWVVLIPALLFTFICDYIGLINDVNGIYSGGLDSELSLTITAQRDFGTFGANMLFLQGLISDNYGSNSPLWSLAYEFWYYMLFPFILYGIRSFSNNNILIGVGNFIVFSLLLLVLYRFNKSLIMMFPIWLLGAIGAYLYFIGSNVNKVLGNYRYLILLLFFTVLFSTRFLSNDILLDYYFGVMTLIFILSILNVKFKSSNWSCLSSNLSNISFTLYLTHFPLIIVLSTIALENYRYELSFIGMVYYLIFNLLAFIVAYFFYVSFETKYKFFKRIIVKPKF